MAGKKDPFLATDDEARGIARRLISTARHGAMAVLLPESGEPYASRVAVAADIDRTPVILVSTLSTHSNGLAEDRPVSLLLGEPGKGDPLAHPRVTLQCKPREVARDDPHHPALRGRFLRRHPKSALYADFGDFSFLRLEPHTASLNAGFGKAYRLAPEDFLIASQAMTALAEKEEGTVAHMNEDHLDAVALYAQVLAGERQGKWTVAGIDAAGFEIAAGDRLRRIEFDAPIEDADTLAMTMAMLARRARDILSGNGSQ